MTDYFDEQPPVLPADFFNEQSPVRPATLEKDPTLRICASYPATDGYCPESIEIEVRESAVDRSFIPDMIAALAMVPGMSRGAQKAREGH